MEYRNIVNIIWNIWKWKSVWYIAPTSAFYGSVALECYVYWISSAEMTLQYVIWPMVTLECRRFMIWISSSYIVVFIREYLWYSNPLNIRIGVVHLECLFRQNICWIREKPVSVEILQNICSIKILLQGNICLLYGIFAMH